MRWHYVCDVGSVAEGNAVRSAWLRRRITGSDEVSEGGRSLVEEYNHSPARAER